LQCPKCGADLPEGSESCPACGEPAPGASAGPTITSGSGATRGRVVYAGFWLRAVAYLLDSFILGVPLNMALEPILKDNRVVTLQDLTRFYTSGTRQGTAFLLLLLMANWLYLASFESSAWQATPGKKILHLMVTDLAGQRLSFVRASARYLGKIVSALTLGIGFLFAGFTRRKQALHDILAGCLVVRKI